MIADSGMGTYVAAKHAVIGLSKAAGIEHASQGIRINALAPGLVETDMTRHWFEDDNIRTHLLANTPIGRAARPEEMADMFLFLCSDSASAAGQVFVLDGGYTAR
jgi:NAD(P)-dependent dehydrogenase (short-subunit alcohol dehydrogenase family)